MAQVGSVNDRLERIEAKLDKVEDVRVLLARIDERLKSHTDRVDWLGQQLEALDKRVSALELSRAKLLGAVTVLGGLSSFAGSYVEKLVG